jgi:hypothetical protein
MVVSSFAYPIAFSDELPAPGDVLIAMLARPLK